MAIQFAVPSGSIHQPEEKKACRRHGSRTKLSRSHVCSSRTARAGQRRGPSHEQVDSDEQVVKLLPLVRRVALQLRGRLPAHVELDDLCSDGTIGLIDAVRKFDPARGVSIESYARYRIRGAILDSLREQDHASRDMRRRLKKIESACQTLERRLGRPANDEEMARAVGLTLEQWYNRIAELQRVGFEGSLSRIPPETGRRIKEEDIPSSPDQSPFVLCYRVEQRELLSRALRCLSERERSIINLYYKDAMTMKQIGVRLGIDESRVSQLHSGAVARLRGRIAAMLQRPATAMGASAQGNVPA